MDNKDKQDLENTEEFIKEYCVRTELETKARDAALLLYKKLKQCENAVPFEEEKKEEPKKEEEVNLKKELIDSVKKSSIYRDILQKFPDAELIDIKQRDNKKND